MPFTLVRRYDFEARHYIPTLPEEHPSSRMHPHDFTVELVVTGEPDPRVGWVVDYFEMDRIFAPLGERLNGAVLNEIEGLEIPTSEMLARWIFRQVKPSLPLLTEVRVAESGQDSTRYAEA